MMFKTHAALLSLLLLAGCAGTGGDTGAVRKSDEARDCFSTTSVRGFSVLNTTTVRLQVGMRDHYELTLIGYCPDIDWTRNIGLRSVSGSSWICSNDAMGVEVIVLDRTAPIGPERCRVRSIRKLEAPQENAAESRE